MAGCEGRQETDGGESGTVVRSKEQEIFLWVRPSVGCRNPHNADETRGLAAVHPQPPIRLEITF